MFSGSTDKLRWYNIYMFVLLLLSWWYSRGWAWVVERILGRFKVINEVFSVGILLRTLFAPWKQIQTAKTFQNFFQSTLDNFISRMIGAVVRIGMLLTAMVLSLLVLTIGLALVIVWPMIPLLIIVLSLISLGVVGS